LKRNDCGMMEEIRLLGPHKMETMLKEEENKPI
jgi:hypothetical protein